MHKNLDELDAKYPDLKIFQLEKYNKPINGKKIDSEPVKKWRDRMNSESGKKTYKMRSETAESSNAQARNRGMNQFKVCSIEKVTCVSLIFAIAHNMAIAFSYAL